MLKSDQALEEEMMKSCE